MIATTECLEPGGNHILSSVEDSPPQQRPAVCLRPTTITERGFPVYTCDCWADHAAADQRARYSTADWYRYAGREAKP